MPRYVRHSITSPVAVLTAGPLSAVVARAAAMASAVLLPIPGTSAISSMEAARSRLSEPKRRNSALRLISPSPGIPSSVLAVIVFERGAQEPPLESPVFDVVDERDYGAAKVWFLRRRDAIA